MDLNIHIERIMNYHSKFFFQNFFETPLKEKKRTPCEKDEKFSLEFIYKTVQC